MNIIFIVKKVLLQFIRDKRTMALIFLMPILIMTIFYFLFKDELMSNIKLGMYLPNQETKVAKGIKEIFEDREEINYVILKNKNLENNIDEYNLDVAVGFDDNLEKDIKENETAKYRIVYEGTKPNIDEAVESIVKAAVLNGYKNSKSTFLKFMGTDLEFEVNTEYKYASEKFGFIDLVSPAFIVFFVYFISFLLTCVSFLRERSYGTLERIFVSPINTVELILGYMLAFVILSSIQALVLLIYTFYILAIKTVANIFLAFIPLFIIVLLGVTMGIFFSTLAKNEFQVIQFIPIVIIPQGLLSGILFEIEAMPEYIRPVSYIMPLTYTNIILKDVLLRGKDLFLLWKEFLILGGFFLLFFFLSFIAIRKIK